MAVPIIPLVQAGTEVLGKGAELASLYNQNKWARENLRQRRKEWEQEMAEREEEKRRRLGVQQLSDLYNYGSWLDDKNKERLDQNYDFYRQNQVRGR